MIIRSSATCVLSRLPAWRIGILDHETAIIEHFALACCRDSARLRACWPVLPLYLPFRSTPTPHLALRSRHYCTAPTSRSQRPSPSLIRACPRRKDANQNGLFCACRCLNRFERLGWRGKIGYNNGWYKIGPSVFV